MLAPAGDRRDDDDDDEPRDSAQTCSVRDFGPGSAFEHPKDVHTFENRTDAPVEFYVVYLVPAGAAPLLNDVPIAPRECA